MENTADRQAFLESLTPAEREEALAAEAAAQRAEERAEQRALAKALRQKEEERQRERAAAYTEIEKLKVLKKREESIDFEKLGNQQRTRQLNGGKSKETEPAKPALASTAASAPASANLGPVLSEKERLIVKQTYLGKSALPEQQEDQLAMNRKKQKTNKKITFKFRWDDTDTTDDTTDPLYAAMLPAASVNQSKKSHRQTARIMAAGQVATFETASTKPLEQMTPRDWRIFRENYEISVKGGQAPPPMRSFRESPAPYLPQLHPALLDAVENVLRFKEPSPIQRQAIPIGLQRRDLIGIAETGSGKTVAFGLPLCHYLLHLPNEILSNVAEDGPLALVMAPTRELALQIEVELQKLLSKQSVIKACGIVGGQPIQQQAQAIRKGVHIIVGTPGRINDMIEQAFLVLNQCCYIVMDEADRMVDMGFLPQMESM